MSTIPRQSFQNYMTILHINKLILVTLLAIMLPGFLFGLFGISYAVSEDMSVSVNTSTIEYENSTLSDQEATGVSISYTMGSMTLSGNMNQVDNIAGTSTDDRSGYSFTLGFAF